MPHACAKERSSACAFHSIMLASKRFGTVLTALTAVLSACGGHNNAAVGNSTTAMSPAKVICGGKPALTPVVRPLRTRNDPFRQSVSTGLPEAVTDLHGQRLGRCDQKDESGQW